MYKSLYCSVACVALLSRLTATWLIEILPHCCSWGSFPGEVRFTSGHPDSRIICKVFNKSQGVHCARVCMCVCVCVWERASEWEKVKRWTAWLKTAVALLIWSLLSSPRLTDWAMGKERPLFYSWCVGGSFAPESWPSGEECVFVFYAGLLLWKWSRSGDHTHSRWPSSHLEAWGPMKRYTWRPKIAFRGRAGETFLEKEYRSVF